MDRKQPKRARTLLPRVLLEQAASFLDPSDFFLEFRAVCEEWSAVRYAAAQLRSDTPLWTRFLALEASACSLQYLDVSLALVTWERVKECCYSAPTLRSLLLRSDQFQLCHFELAHDLAHLQECHFFFSPKSSEYVLNRSEVSVPILGEPRILPALARLKVVRFCQIRLAAVVWASLDASHVLWEVFAVDSFDEVVPAKLAECPHLRTLLLMDNCDGLFSRSDYIPSMSRVTSLTFGPHYEPALINGLLLQLPQLFHLDLNVASLAGTDEDEDNEVFDTLGGCKQLRNLALRGLSYKAIARFPEPLWRRLRKLEIQAAFERLEHFLFLQYCVLVESLVLVPTLDGQPCPDSLLVVLTRLRLLTRLDLDTVSLTRCQVCQLFDKLSRLRSVIHDSQGRSRTFRSGQHERVAPYSSLFDWKQDKLAVRPDNEEPGELLGDPTLEVAEDETDETFEAPVHVPRNDADRQQRKISQFFA